MNAIGDSALPAINESLLPADVRNGSAEDKKAYSAALGFERSLLAQLTKTMSDTTKTDDSSDDSEDSGDSGETAATQMYKDMLPDRLADSLIASGGIGLAEDLYRAVRQGVK
jgi:Rod binding domain-containing protein